jgi:uncharacterized membrane protein YphA (DoxX/SURF4 family)
MSAIFVTSGLDILRNPATRARTAEPVVGWVAERIPIAPRDPETAVHLTGLVHLGAGAMLAAGVLPRLTSLALAVSLLPIIAAGHRFWEIDDPQQRRMQRTQFLKNAAILGGLLVVALD